MHTYCRGKCGIPLADFFPLSGIFFKEKRSSCRGLSTCLHSTPAISAPTLLLLLPSPLFPHSFTGSVLDFSPSPGPGAPAATPPPPSRLCVWGRMEKGGSVQQANQAFCLCLCVCGGGVKGLSTLALEQQQLVQRRKRERVRGRGEGGLM